MRRFRLREIKGLHQVNTGRKLELRFGQVYPTSGTNCLLQTRTAGPRDVTCDQLKEVISIQNEPKRKVRAGLGWAELGKLGYGTISRKGPEKVRHQANLVTLSDPNFSFPTQEGGWPCGEFPHYGEKCALSICDEETSLCKATQL